MLKFRLAALNSAEATADVLAAFELASYFIGEVKPDILPIDIDSAREWYIKHRVDETNQADYYSEPQIVDDELTENFSRSLLEMIESRNNALGDHYPFVVKESGPLIMQSSETVSSVGACYLSLQFFRGLTGGTIEICGENPEDEEKCRNNFDQQFRKIFEFIAGYAVAGKRDGAPYMISDCRSARRLEVLLQNICRKVGSGQVRSYDEWNSEQRSANDANVDCLVHLGGPGVPGHAEIELIGATVQKDRISSKIIGQEKLNFFSNFFVQQPTAFKGVLVRPMDEDEYLRGKCANKQCLLFSYDEVWRGLGRRTGGDYQLSALRRLDAKVRNLLRTFRGAVFLDDFDDEYPLGEC